MTPFSYKNKVLHCEALPLPDIASAAGTPLYVYSAQEMVQRARSYQSILDGQGLVCYAVKANGNPAILRLLAAEGLGADVTSGGELFLALHAGIVPEKIIYSGVGKRVDEMRMALKAGIRALHLESAMELEFLAEVAAEMQTIAPVGVRVNPDISVETHAYDSTGELGHKFGVPRETALALFVEAQAHPWLKPVGLAAHIGSQITQLDPYARLAEYLVELACELREAGIHLQYIDAGGGLGINYRDSDAPPIEEWLSAVLRPVCAAGYELVTEPGRSIVGPAGGLLAAVLYTKEQGGKSFVIVDGGLNDLIRPAMYGAYHPAWPVEQKPGLENEYRVVDIVGPVCETGDFLAQERPMPAMKAGEMLLFGQAGAYGFAMSSNYNGRLRPAEVLVSGESFEVVRKRQVYEHLLDGTTD
ncbi:MAG: diaminopimelate decarboxylase [Candidatus Promineifilaceae bacterium]|nr:diaminopimelate decarboxylase [Candidatus Promineifilaceae bacterium]